MNQKLLICGQSVKTISGLSYVAVNFLKQFYQTGKYEISYVNILGQDSRPEDFIKYDKFFKNIKDVSIFNLQLNDRNKVNRFDDLVIEKFKPDIIITFIDPWYLEQIILSKYIDSFLLVSYLTIETPHIPEYMTLPTLANSSVRKSLKQILNKVDCIIPVTEMGKLALENLGLKPERNVYNGIDISNRCIEEVDKQDVFNSHIVQNDSFIFMTVGDNNERKKIDNTVIAFSEFLKKVDNPKKYLLYVHSNLNIVKGGTDIISLVVDLRIENNFIGFKSENGLLSWEKLYKRYKACDCYICLPSGEGFNYGPVEAMMHKKPVVYIDYGGHAEYLEGIGIPVKVKSTFCARNIPQMWAIPDYDDAVHKMLYMVNNYDKIKDDLGNKGFNKIKEFDWNIVGKQLISKVEEKYKEFDKINFNLKRII